MATTPALQPIPFGAKPIAPIPFGSKPIAPVTTAPAPAPEPGLGEKLVNTAKETVGAVGQRFNNAVQAESDSMSGKITAPEAGVRIFGQLVGGANDVIGGTVKAGAQTANAATGGLAGKAITGALKAVGNTPLGTLGVNAITQGVEKWNAFQDQYPRAAKDLQAVPEVAQLLANFVGLGAGKTGVGLAAKEAGYALKDSGVQAGNKQLSQFARDLTRPIRTPAVKEAEVSRTSEIGGGLLKRSIIEPTPAEAKAAVEVTNVPGINPHNTFQQNYNIISDYARHVSDKLEKDIAANDFVIPKKEVTSALNAAKTALADSPVLVGDAQKTAAKLLAGAQKFINQNAGTGSGLLKAKKEFDQWVLSQKPKAFDATADNAFTIANREIRNTFKDILDKNATGVGVKESLAKQHNLLNALDNIEPKAAKEADSAIGRLSQRATEVLGTKNKAVQALAALVGIGGLGAAATFAPPAAILGTLGFLTYQGGKLVAKPALRKAVGDVLIELGNKVTPAERAVIMGVVNKK